MELSPKQHNQIAIVEKILADIKAVYAIRMPDGSMLGDLTALVQKPDKPRRGQLTFPRGEIRAYVVKYLAGIDAGEIRRIPAGAYGVDRVQSAACMYMTEMHEAGMYHTRRDGDDIVVNFDCGLPS